MTVGVQRSKRAGYNIPMRLCVSSGMAVASHVGSIKCTIMVAVCIVHCGLPLLPCCRVLTTHVRMVDLLRKTAVLALLLFALLAVLVVQLWQLGRWAAVQHRPKSSKKKVRFVGAGKSMGDYHLGAGRKNGMERACFTTGTDVREHRFDPALYSHLPSWQHPLPDDNHWEPPPSTLPLGWGSTQTSYDTVGIPHRRASSLGPMSALLGEVREGGGHPLDLYLSPTCSMHVSRTLIVDHNNDGRRPMTVATDVPTKGLSSASVNRQQEVAMKDIGAAVADSVQRGVTGGTMTAESPPVIERIIARVSNMCAAGHGERGGIGNVGCEEEGEVDGDNEDDSDSGDEEEDVVQKVTARGGKKKASTGRGKVRHFEVDENDLASLRFTVDYGFARGLLTHVVAFTTKVGDAIPDRWDFGVDVLADLVDLLVSNVAMEFNDRLDKAAAYRVHVDPPLYGREYLHGEIGIVVDGFE
ncbi:hypothetical protein CBR_g49536 [Chara braunii]|uniref:Uncharacterized protein n=1 Tax=Chara braunii TaxID=69332 RepID=A0A388M5C2_CHABU|nr:hypothetical protein CBR_g49536 [Chara braunii]|eukprot:GBG89683.1 hypothetical protein CBR_g49536 [Chara braunii]